MFPNRFDRSRCGADLGSTTHGNSITWTILGPRVAKVGLAGTMSVTNSGDVTTTGMLIDNIFNPVPNPAFVDINGATLTATQTPSASNFYAGGIAVFGTLTIENASERHDHRSRYRRPAERQCAGGCERRAAERERIYLACIELRGSHLGKCGRASGRAERRHRDGDIGHREPAWRPLDQGGTVTVSGSGSKVTTNGGGIIIADGGAGYLSVTSGASVEVTTTNPNYAAFTLGNLSGSSGTLSVSGSGSGVTTNGGGINVGFDGTGTLSITNGATVQATESDPTDCSRRSWRERRRYRVVHGLGRRIGVHRQRWRLRCRKLRHGPRDDRAGWRAHGQRYDARAGNRAH